MWRLRFSTIAAVLLAAGLSHGAELAVVLDSTRLVTHSPVSGYLDLEIGEEFVAWDFPGLRNGMAVVSIEDPGGDVFVVDRNYIVGITTCGFDSSAAPKNTYAAGRYILPFFFLKREEVHGGYILENAGEYRITVSMDLPEGNVVGAAVLTVERCDDCDVSVYDSHFSDRVAYMYPFERPLKRTDFGDVADRYEWAARVADLYCRDAYRIANIANLLERPEGGVVGGGKIPGDIVDAVLPEIRDAVVRSRDIVSAGVFWRRVAQTVDPDYGTDGGEIDGAYPMGDYRVYLLR